MFYTIGLDDYGQCSGDVGGPWDTYGEAAAMAGYGAVVACAFTHAHLVAALLSIKTQVTVDGPNGQILAEDFADQLLAELGKLK